MRLASGPLEDVYLELLYVLDVTSTPEARRLRKLCVAKYRGDCDFYLGLLRAAQTGNNNDDSHAQR